MAHIPLNKKQINRVKKLAKEIAGRIQEFISKHSTVSVERTVLRLYGVDGVDSQNIPLSNRLVEILQKKEMLKSGVSRCFAAAMLESGKGARETAELIEQGKIDFGDLKKFSLVDIKGKEKQLAGKAIASLDATRKSKEEKQKRSPLPQQPWRYIIVATGNIYEDCIQAKSAVLAGADIIAVIRSTAQSLLDYVPFGPTTEGFGGTFATQANFRIMRDTLDEVSEKEGRYVRLVNYSSGLCMSEIAACAAFEDLDILLNDSMYGILFRDINMKRTFIDQYFSRLICSRSKIMINTGEDNYLTTSDAIDNAFTVISSQLINEAMARNALLTDELLGLGHAFEVDPKIENAFLYELAHAQLARQLFPGSPLKYMPPTKYMSTDIFYSHCLDTLFNMASVITGQGIHLAGILTEAIHTPLMQDRYQSLCSVDYVFNIARGLGDEIEFKKDGFIAERAQQVLDETEQFLKELRKTGLMKAISKGRFANISRAVNGGKGLDGVFKKGPDYSNPIMSQIEQEVVVPELKKRAFTTSTDAKTALDFQKDAVESLNNNVVKPYGDTLNDGMVQLSFTLPVENSEKAKKAAELYVSKLNFENITVAHSKKIADNFTYFVVYASAIPKLDYYKLKVSEVKTKPMSFYEINELIRLKIKRRLSVIGASIGNDAHTVGIDAIMNMKGYNRDYGLERYPEINTCNMGAQVTCEELLEKAFKVDADAILISQTVTQKEMHVRNFSEFIKLLKAKNIKDRFLLLAGGPRMTNQFAVKLGYDAGFGPGTTPSQVASFIVNKIKEKA